jgi:Sulfotransferase family
VTTLPPSAQPAGGLDQPPPESAGRCPPPARPHILVVNGRKVRQPVFIISAPHGGAEMMARSFKRTPGFHMTLGQRWVIPVVQAFARTPSLARGRQEAAATVLRDAFAQGWQIGPGSCLACTPACREAAGSGGSGPCAAEQEISRYGDASPELLYCAESLVHAFPDARLVQIVRDGRDVVAAMLSDALALAWFRPGFVNLDAEATHPLLGVDTPADRGLWAGASLAGKCAMRWRGTVRLMARLRMRLSPEQLITLRHEDMARQPAGAASSVSAFTGVTVTPPAPVAGTALEPGIWRKLLTAAQAAEVEQVAGEELRRVGYGA